MWLRLHQRAAAAIKSSQDAKLALRYYGPFKVIERIGSVAYRLQLLNKARIHNVFHVVFLKKYHGTAPTDIVPLPTVVHGHAVPEPGHIVRTRLNHGVWELLVQWLSQSPAASTWELLNDFKATYPKFQLEDELFRKEGGSVVDAFIGKQYSRKKKKAPASSG